MKRSTWDGDTIVYKYLVPRTVDMPAHALEQLEKALHLRRELVRSEREFDDLRAEIWTKHPDVGAAQGEVDQAVADFSAVKEQLTDERIEDRSTAPRVKTHAALVAARKVLTAARAKLKEVKTTAGPEVVDHLNDLDKQRQAARKELRKIAVENGLFWATGNAVLDDHTEACKQVIRLRKDGRAAQRRMPRFDDAATLSTQIQRGAGKPARSPELLASGVGPYRNVIQLTPWVSPDDWPRGRGPHRRAVLTLRIAGKDAPPLVLPIYVSRPIPKDADITDVQVTRRFVGGKQRISVALTLHVPKPEPRTTGDSIAVRFGWKSHSKGMVQVATVATATGPLSTPVPDSIKNLVQVVDGCNILLTSPFWLRDLEYYDQIRANRALAMEEIKAKVATALDADAELAEKMAAELERERLEVIRWRSPGRMARLTWAWPDDHPLKAHMEEWRRWDKKQWQVEAHGRDHIAAARRDAYRKMAAWICEAAKEVSLAAFSIADLTQVPAVGTEDTEVARRARANRQWAAPGDLRTAIVNAAQRRGVEVLSVTTEIVENGVEA